MREAQVNEDLNTSLCLFVIASDHLRLLKISESVLAVIFPLN